MNQQTNDNNKMRVWIPIAVGVAILGYHMYSGFSDKPLWIIATIVLIPLGIFTILSNRKESSQK